jgi:hypothetical protein
VFRGALGRVERSVVNHVIIINFFKKSYYNSATSPRSRLSKTRSV